MGQLVPATPRLYAFYCFDYRWSMESQGLKWRLSHFEGNWAYFSGEREDSASPPPLCTRQLLHGYSFLQNYFRPLYFFPPHRLSCQLPELLWYIKPRLKHPILSLPPQTHTLSLTHSLTLSLSLSLTHTPHADVFRVRKSVRVAVAGDVEKLPGFQPVLVRRRDGGAVYTMNAVDP
jgi:hypothetical protein